jgi:hypothetical protein
MTAQEAAAANRALLDTAARLVDEMDNVAPGSVLRCFSRAVRTARSLGCPLTRLPAEADRLARQWLGERMACR